MESFKALVLERIWYWSKVCDLLGFWLFLITPASWDSLSSRLLFLHCWSLWSVQLPLLFCHGFTQPCKITIQPLTLRLKSYGAKAAEPWGLHSSLFCFSRSPVSAQRLCYFGKVRQSYLAKGLHHRPPSISNGARALNRVCQRVPYINKAAPS